VNGIPAAVLEQHGPNVASGGSAGWLAASVFAQAALALYFQAINWLPLGSWNYQPGFEPLATQAAHGRLAAADFGYVVLFLVPVTLYLVAAHWRWLWLMWIGLVGYTVWLVVQVVSWWIPYAFGASDTWMATYQRVFSHSTQLLPSAGRHLAPDGVHIILSLLLAVVVVTTATGLVRLTLSRWSEKRR
jgi:hypothetical protein